MNEEIMFTKDVMAFLHYSAMSSFIEFYNDKKNGFPKPFKIGRRNTWHREDVEKWLEDQRAKANAA
ncbi:AlpA family phage regulatory protein [Salmonella enterica subsp. salamae]|nr:AlpA family phage regulatory protein [Salmonella enterica subsp. salamae]